MEDHTTEEIPTKQCSRCKETKPATTEYFQRNQNRPDGLSAHCKDCTWEKRNPEQNQTKNRRWMENNRNAAREAVRRQRKEYPERATANNKRSAEKRKLRRKTDPEYAAAQREQGKRSYRAHKERYFEQSKKWKEKNPDKVRQYNRAWYAKRTHVATAHTQRHLARKRNLPNTLTADQWQAAVGHFNGNCAVCERPMNGFFHAPHADHWIALSDPNCPGTVPHNIVPLCGGTGGCNQSKGNKPAAEWLNAKFGKRKAAAILERIEAYFATVQIHD